MPDQQHHILIVEDDPLVAGDLAMTVERAGGHVVGPVACVPEALDLLRSKMISGAVLNAELMDRDLTSVALDLVRRAVPFVIQTAIGLPAELVSAHPALPVVLTPCAPRDVVALLFELIQPTTPSPLANADPEQMSPTVSDVSSQIDGYQEANQVLRDVYSGVISLREAWQWVAELHAEQLGALANEVEKRLPTAQ